MPGRRPRRARNLTRVISDKLHELHRALTTWSLDDLREVDRDILSFDSTNCWCFEMEHQAALRQIVLLVIKEKEDEARRAAGVLGTEYRT